MKKSIFFLIFICSIIIGSITNTYAEETNFYEAEFINDIYMNRIFSNQKGTIHYQKARFFRQARTGEYAYCVEPTAMFNDGANYTSSNSVSGLSDSAKERIKLLAYYGYQYPGHEDSKWYAITQLLIWQIADPDGEYYFTNGLNGPRIDQFSNEIQELNNLVNRHNTKPNITVPEFVNTNSDLKLTDSNNVLNNFTTSLGKIEGNTLTISNLAEKHYSFTLTKETKRTNKAGVFFISSNSQNIYMTGDLDPIKLEYTFKAVETNLKINKVDSDTKTSNNRGKASIEGTIFKLYKDNKEISELIIKDGKAEIEHLDFGTYILQEVKAGTGYVLNEDKIKIIIDGHNSKVELTLKNDIIKKTITIHKTYGEDVFIGESNVIFNVYDEDDNLIDTIATDDNGYATITLTYGKYTLKQITGKEGYERVKPITIIVEDKEDQLIELQDHKITVEEPETTIEIKVPDTNTDYDLIDYFYLLLKLLLCSSIY